jgi:MFS family permease
MITNTVSQKLISKPPERGDPHSLGQRASFWVAASVVMHTLWTSAAPAMSYPLYASEWHLTPTVTTAVFAVYPLVVVTVLICFGDISDYIGRRTTMLVGLGASLMGVLLFAIAPSVHWIFLGRFFMGVGVGLSAAPSAAAMVEFSPTGQAGRAGSITTAAQALGLALALLVGGALIAYAPFSDPSQFLGALRCHRFNIFCHLVPAAA